MAGTALGEGARALMKASTLWSMGDSKMVRRAAATGAACRDPLKSTSMRRKGRVSKKPAPVEYTEATTPLTTMVPLSVIT
eukprot:3821283-Rhodomonas_salina.1